jgi:hypothetical protein
MLRIPLVAAGLLATALAGCAGGGGGGGGGDPASQVDFDELGLEATATTGVIRGIVIDAAVRPVADVRILARGPDGATAETLSNPQGAFGLQGLAPGDWFLVANRSGYRETQASAQVVAGLAEPDVVKVLLEADPSAAPYVTTHLFEGYLECSFRAVVIGYALCSSTANDRFTESYAPEGVPDWWQSEMVWDSTQAFGSELSLDISCISGDPCPDGQVLINRSEGQSPLLVTIGRAKAEEFLLGAGQDVVIRVFAFGRQDTDLVDDRQLNERLNETSGGAVPCVEWPAVFDACVRFGGVGIILSQKFTVYSHEFHRYAPPAGWRFTVDGPPPAP